MEYQNLEDTVHVKVNAFLEEQIAYYEALWGWGKYAKGSASNFYVVIKTGERGNYL
ncbi:hypothetical protein [Halalkalibacter alkalisediminis]|uniref:Uncharacterized protein n=1 Tax=Halalkalibacter alkalisediminis TaxID=935616 RepID=A0ABV6NDY3_9BACI|nr:hypothetical protein [Halalkalibacter alkalisediminis]